MLIQIIQKCLITNLILNWKQSISTYNETTSFLYNKYDLLGFFK
jgi:hypothetical protein